MNFEEQLLIGELLMTIAVLSASHAHACPVATRIVRTATTTSATGQLEATGPTGSGWAASSRTVSGLNDPGSRRHR